MASKPLRQALVALLAVALLAVPAIAVAATPHPGHFQGMDGVSFAVGRTSSGAR